MLLVSGVFSENTVCTVQAIFVCKCVCVVYILSMFRSDNEAHTGHTTNAAGSALVDGY